MNFLALDQSLNITGYAIFSMPSPRIPKLISSGTFTIKPNQNIEARLGELWKQLNQLVEQENISYIFFEDIQYQNNKDTFKKLAYVQAAILLWCYWNNINYSILSPSHWRKIITDNYGIKFGRARAEQKKACYDFVTQKWHMSKDNTTEDETDAIALGMAGIIEYDKQRSNW